MPVTIDLEYLIEFLNELRAVGFDVSTQQYIAAQDLLIALAANGHLPEDPRSLRTLLAPVVCSTPREQESFYRYFDRWIKRNPQAAKPAQTAGELEPAVDDVVKRSWTRIFREPASVAGSLILVAGLVTGIAVLVSAQTLTLTGSVVNAKSNDPLGGATISYSQKTVSSDSAGKFSLTYRNKELPIQVVIQSNGYEAGNEVIDTSTQSLVVRLMPLPIPTPTPPIEPPNPNPTPVVVELIELPPSPAASGNLGTWRRYGWVLLPLFLFGGWWIWKTRLSRALLHRLQRVTEPRLDQLVVKGGAGQLFQGPSFRRTIQELRRHRQRGASELDAQRTVSRTVQRGGLFTPAYGSRQALPEYLVLIDRASFADQQARLEDEIVRRLVQDNVFVDSYHFQGDPRHCRKHGTNSPYFSLQEIAALHPEHHLIIFSDGSTFINPLTGEPERWVEMFSSWTTRALMTPESPAHWGHRERALAELDFIILPATKEGLAALTELLGGGARASVELDRRTRPYPSMLRDRTMRWLENHEPVNLQRLCDQLKVFLGAKGYQWLSACAVYPVLHWDLTLYLGFKVFRDRIEIEDRLLSLVRLPWFRYGSIPDWLRLRLISDLPPKDEASVRKALEDLLLTVMEQPADGIRLDIATDEKDSLGFIERLKKRFKSWKFRRWFWQFAKDEPPESPLRDYVFLGFMSGRKPRKLTVSLPDTIRKFVFPQGQSALGLRPASLLALAIATSLTVLVIAKTKAGPEPATVYVQMSAEQQRQFVRQSVHEILGRLGSGATTIGEKGISKIKEDVDYYAQRVGNNSTQAGSEDLLIVFGRAIPYAPIINKAFQDRSLPPMLGLYLNFESENPLGPTSSADHAAIQSAGVAAGCSEIFDSDSARLPLLILCYYQLGPTLLEKTNGWDLLNQPEIFVASLPESLKSTYTANLPRLPQFFAAAIVGENPQTFRMKMNPLSSYVAINAAPTPTPDLDPERIPQLIAQFSGDNREAASDELIQLYPQNKAAVVEALINAILSDTPMRYRVNLYIARTLGKIEPNWEGRLDQLAALQALRATRDYGDPTFKSWVDRAISGFVEIQTPVLPSPSPSPSPSPTQLNVRTSTLVRPNYADTPVRTFLVDTNSPVPLEFSFSFGDGSRQTPWQSNPRIVHTYPGEGTFQARVYYRARDSQGNILAQGSEPVEVVVVPPQGTIPNLVGKTEDEVRRLLGPQVQFALGDITYTETGSFPSDTVIAQRPAPGTPAPNGTKINIVVAVAPLDVPVPDLRGRRLAEAQRMISAAGLRLRVDPISPLNPRSPQGVAPSDVIKDQSPPPGTRVRRGAFVTVK